MNNVLHKSLLYDYYGALLTDKQRETFEMHYLNDMSLSEISLETGVSPQGVSDMIKRSEKLLIKYEEKLNLVKNHGVIRQKLEEITHLLDEMGEVKANNIEDIKILIEQIRESV
ncbi:YlxM family DNA-binding protein [Tyzzerella sp. OttesenSCG-928-J15]|nr:YlxM family DNA-binding protein [Tyzzerella sp. OttesenSCG-928-J15]